VETKVSDCVLLLLLPLPVLVLRVLLKPSSLYYVVCPAVCTCHKPA
jgi:hypothetical protein